MAASASGDGVRLGPGLISLGTLAKRFDIAELARPIMAQLAMDLGETIDLFVFNGNNAVVVDQIEGTHVLRAAHPIGSALHLHSSAAGKAWLAQLPSDVLEKIRSHMKLEKTTANTIVSWERLERELSLIRKEGVAVDREESRVGVCAVATVIGETTGEMAALSIPTPTERFLATEQKLRQTLMEHCRVLQQWLRH